jgi:hypothetical protein
MILTEKISRYYQSSCNHLRSVFHTRHWSFDLVTLPFMSTVGAHLQAVCVQCRPKVKLTARTQSRFDTGLSHITVNLVFILT